MHGLINCGLQSFAEEIYGKALWLDLVEQAGLPFANFETMLTYDDEITVRVIDHLAKLTRKSRVAILEDFGTFLVSEHSTHSVLKLLTLGGDSYRDFLNSLEDVYARVKIALPELDIPQMHLYSVSEAHFELRFSSVIDGYGEVFLGLLRAMADHYRVLAILDIVRKRTNRQFHYVIDIKIYEEDWTPKGAAA